MNDFDIFWKAYPKKKSKGDARKAWAQTEKIRPELQELLKVIANYCKSEDWQKDGGKWIPYPATFLRDERWEDEMEVDLPDVVDGKPWHETWPGIQAKGRELGIEESRFAHPQEFKSAVIKAAKEGLKAA